MKQRSKRVMRKKVIIPKPESDVPLEGPMLEESDICQLCNAAWLAPEQVDILVKMSPCISSAYFSCSDRAAQLSFLDDIKETMIICDSCDRSFHLMCLGLSEAPEGEWFCTWCDMIASSQDSPSEIEEAEIDC